VTRNPATRPIKEDCQKLLAEMNGKYAVVKECGKTLVLEETYDPVMERRRSERSTFRSFRDFHHQEHHDENGVKTTVGSWWLNHPNRRQYDGVTFKPGVGHIEKHYNLWRGFAVDPVKGDWSLYREHLRLNICRGDDDQYAYVMAWMAQGVQDPSTKPEVAIVLRSEERGTGQSLFCRYYRRLFGQHGIEISNPQHLTGRFNGHLEDCCCLVLTEAFWTGSHYAEATLKALITEDSLAIEPKYVGLKFVRNYLRVLMTSNAHWVVPAGTDERRFLVLDIGTEHKQDTAYFAAIAKQMDNRGLAAMLYDLKRYDYSSVDLRKAPNTGGLTEQKILSLPPAEKWLFGKLLDGQLLKDDDGWCPEVDKDALHADFSESLRGIRSREARSSQTELGMFLARMFGEGIKEYRPSVGNLRVRRWLFPSLEECRALFDARLGTRFPWPEEQGSGARQRLSTSQRFRQR
jgi:Mesyanzhinovviridae DNA primase